ncbi:MAG: glycoside hydrolase family 2 protein [Lachnospiraceae bacterium]|nr:glycoside hydrolase family 2 protein [Lachnospiraceae bacterium]
MLSIDLCGEKWNMTDCGSEKRYKATAPGSVLSVLRAAGEIPDPYAGENEKDLLYLFEHDYEFDTVFNVRGDMLQEEVLEMVFEGIDTISEIYLNGEKLGRTKNMHRTYRFPVKDKLHMGSNDLKIHLFSPLQYIKDHKNKAHKDIEWCADGAVYGGHMLRKAHSSFGWDWGPALPDMGVFRSIKVEGWSKVRLKSVYFFQEHDRENGGVTLFVDPVMEFSDPLPVEVNIDVSGEAPVEIMTRMPDPGVMSTQKGDNEMGIPIHSPRLWWPNGYGTQELYEVKISLKKANRLYDEKTFRVGLRTIELSHEKDEYGEEFCFVVNGVKIFARGANYVPEDAVYPYITKDKQRRLVEAAAAANFNCLRVWGGGYYQSDYFYDLCDEAGILVWQDLMYASNIYDMTSGFEKSILAETADNVARLRHHACLALWCGNDEIESAWDTLEGFKDHSPALKADYIKMFEYLLPKKVRDEDESTPWWPSSPSSGGCFDMPGDENRGDSHYWDVWHGLKPFTEYGEHHFRFLSAFGFQSFPSYKTVKSYAKPEERNIFSPVMESHQKNRDGNGKILHYMSKNFRYPKDFEQLLYVSQIQQGMVVEYGVDHFRRERGRCMGTLYWQLNDNWPVASWSSIDYYGRRKALHYMAARFYAPVAGSLLVEGSSVTAYLVNDSMEQVKLRVRLTLMTTDGQELMRFSDDGRVDPGKVFKGQKRDFAKLCDKAPGEVYLMAEFDADGTVFYKDVTFVPYKHLDLKKPDISVEVRETEDAWQIVLSSDVYAPFVMLELKEADAVFSDNAFSLHKGRERVITVLKKDMSAEPEDAESFLEQLKIYDLYNSY